MAISNSSQQGMMSEINVTPLVDVMLVLLVVFIVTAPLLTPQSLKSMCLKLKKSQQPPTRQNYSQHI
ncbi:MAG: biopolymer transporter ExbD [Nitrosomonadales bacterium]|nr:biopolymer transporter ExbD [Nitrosomonadales bacterium]